jgi:soluble lytic murein transglycosylase
MLREAAQRAVQDGDFAAAAAGYAALVEGEGALSDARFALGAALLRDGQYAPAAEALRGALAQPEPPPSTVHVFLAEALRGMAQPLAAVEHYRTYIASGTVITAHVQEWIGDALQEAGDPAGAAEAYRRALGHADDRSSVVGLREKIAQAHAARGAYGDAIAEYDAILAIAQYPGYRAHIEYLAAETEWLAGETDGALERYRRVVETYPTQEDAHFALIRLVDAGVPVDDRLRGIVDYHAGAYEPAILALIRYYMEHPTSHPGDVHWYAGESFLALEDTANAAREFSLLIDTHPGDELVDAAWIGLAETYAAADDMDGAVYTYWRLAEVREASPRAPEALWEAAVLLERSGAVERAAEAYGQCQARYPDSDYAERALFRSGLSWYRTGDLVSAAVAWDTLGSTGGDPALRAAGLFWLGRVRSGQGDAEAARSAYAQALAVDPLGYYGLRASQLVTDLGAPAFPMSASAGTADRELGREEAERWLADWAGALRPDTTQAGAALPEDLRLRRGLELWILGRYSVSRAELEALRAAVDEDPYALFELALVFREIGLYRSSILCAVRLIDLSPAANALEAPEFVGRLAYPDYYRHLVIENAGEFGLDPLLVLAIIRQESLFESLATSSAAAHGLMQVIPPTGELIAVSLGWPPDYQTADLYRPFVSVRFGTYYLATQLEQFDGRAEVALAAYNGGPGNAMRWLAEAGDDPDLFFELITFSETRRYVSRIREQLAVYQALYG